MPAKGSTRKFDLQVLKWSREGKSVAEIAKHTGKAHRSIAYAKKRGLEYENNTALLAEAVSQGSDPIPYAELAPEVQACVEFSVDGFERFFNRYRGREDRPETLLQPIHKEWVRSVLNDGRSLINCPPRHAKSTIFSVWFPLWLLAMDRDVQILLCSQTDALTKKFCNEISWHLSYNQELITDFGRFRPELGDWPWRPNSGELLVEGRSRGSKSGDLSIQVRGAGQAILGMECNWVIVDDAVSRKHVNSESERNRLSEWFHGDVMSRLEPGGRALVIGQRLHIYDLYGELAGEKLPTGGKRWNHLNFKAIVNDETKETLWPTKWSYDELMDRHADVGYAIFEAMYQQNPLPEGMALARRAWFYGDEEHPGCLDLDRAAGEAPQALSKPVRVLSLDPSPTRYAGLIVADLDWNQKYLDLHVIEVVRKPMNVREMLNQIERVIAMYTPKYFIFEQNAAQRWLLQDPAMEKFRKSLHVIPHTTSRNKKDPVLGVESLATDFEFGRVHLPYGDAESKEMSEYLIKEALEYPQGATDDLLMALWFIKTNMISLMPTDDLDAQNTSAFRLPTRLKDGWSLKRKKA